jgi:hypothetical protein
MNISKVKLEPIEQSHIKELAESFFIKCCFCEKRFKNNHDTAEFLIRLSGDQGFFCPFCIRNGFNTKNSRNILILSFRSLVGYCYLERGQVKDEKIISNQITKLVEKHKKIGLMNPIFYYDSETMLWFINFEKVGNTRKKVSIEEINQTIQKILECFLQQDSLSEVDIESVYQKYKKAIEIFYSKRRRPNKKRMLIPTLGLEMKSNVNIRNFTWNITKCY